MLYNPHGEFANRLDHENEHDLFLMAIAGHDLTL
jgi:hypothetical protein